jgi:16S rRNA (guanine966-N2)-methyltransferase
VRIVAGEFKGHRLQAPQGDTTRPTIDRVREALFSSLTSLAGPRLGGGSALDAFAGSGALGLEALSRGMSSVTFVETDRAALGALNANIRALGVGGRTYVVAGDMHALAQRGGLHGRPFSLLLLDPPYRLDAVEIAHLISGLAAHDLLKDGALVVYEHARSTRMSWPSGLSPVSTKRYGSTEIDVATYERGAGSA